MEAQAIKRLQRVADRVRVLASRSPTLKAAIQQSLVGMNGLLSKHRAHRDAMEKRERDLVRAVLRRGHMHDRSVEPNTFTRWVWWEGLCPVDLAPRVRRFTATNLPERSVERRMAVWALKALDRDGRYSRSKLDEQGMARMAAGYRRSLRGGKLVQVRWQVIVARPDDWLELPNPYSMEMEDLRRLSDADYQTVTLFHLGGLADIGTATANRFQASRNRRSTDRHRPVLRVASATSQ